MIFSDSVQMSNDVRYTSDGYLVTSALVARTGVQEYLGSEVGKPETPIVRVYRPPSTIFDSKALSSYAHRPITNGHRGDVTAKNWREFAVGTMGSEVLRDGDFVRVPLVLMDQAAIDDYKNGKRELSLGYDGELVFQDGISPEGEPYNAVLTTHSANHLAMVDAARGGDKLRIGDTRAPAVVETAHQPKGGHQMAGENVKVVMVDGFSITTTEQGAQAIDRLQGQIKDRDATIKMADSANTAALAAKDAEIAALTAKLADAEKAKLSDAQVDSRVAERAKLLNDAATVHPEGKFDGLSDAAIRAAVVTAKLGDAAVAGKDAAYVAARFDVLVEGGAGHADPMRAVLRDGKPTAPADNGQAAYLARISDAWKQK